MPYTKTVWTQGVTPTNQTNMSNLETQYDESTLSYNRDLFSAFVLSGLTAAKDGVIANQLDVAAGVAYPLQADSTLRRRSLTSSTQTTSALSSTYYLYLQPDGTWYWNTANSPAANSLAICTVATDVSGNISTVTDTRVVNPTLLANLAGAPTISTNGPALRYVNTEASGHTWQAFVRTTALGSDNNFSFFDSTSGVTALNISPTGILAPAGGFSTLNGQPTAGSFGVPLIVAQAINTHIIATGNQTVLSFTPAATGMYRLNGWFEVHSGTGGVNFLAGWNDPTSGVTGSGYFVSNTATPAAWNNVSVNATGGAQVFSNSPLTFYAGTGAAITVTFGGTNDCYVSVILERLS